MSEYDSYHFIDALETNIGSNYCVLKVDWCYKREYFNVAIHCYVIKSITQLQHNHPSKP